MTEDTDRGRPIYSRACPNCEAYTLSYYASGGVAVLEPSGRTVVVVGVPVESCRTPGCLWAAPAEEAVAVVQARAAEPGDAVREYGPGRWRV